MMSIPQDAKGRHWAIVVFDSLHVEGDERSRTNPGHGYGAHSVETSTYTPYVSEGAWIEEIERLESGRRSVSYIAFICDPVTVKKKTEINISYGT